MANHPGNAFGQGKNAPLIAMAHEIPYVATATVADLRDLEYKVERAMGMRGARYLHVLVSCPLGWGAAARDSIKIARLAKETGLFPVFEAEQGEVTAVSKIRRREPVEEYLRLQRRFAHLFGEHGHPEVVERIQALADRNIERFGLLDEEDEVTQKPFAITLDPGSSLANHTGSWRTERPEYVHRHAPVQQRLPGRRERAAVALPRRGGRRVRGRLAADHGGQPVPGDHGAGLLPPVRDELQPRRLDEAVGINSIERFLGDEAIKQGWTVEPLPSPPASASWSWAPARPGCPPPTTSLAWATR